MAPFPTFDARRLRQHWQRRLKLAQRSGDADQIDTCKALIDACDAAIDGGNHDPRALEVEHDENGTAKAKAKPKPAGRRT